MIGIGSAGDSSSRQPLRRIYRDWRLLIAWWFVIAGYITFFDSVSSRAAYVPLFASVEEHVWYAITCAGLIGALSAERNKLFWSLISVLGEVIALAVTVIAVTFVSGLLPG